jgi:DNA-binding MarR family transcriptional regulator
MADPEQPRRLTLLYQLYLASTESRQFMRLALRDTDMSGEEYGIYSYFYANGARTQSQASADLGYPVTTLASLLAPIVESGDLVRRPHPTDRRARLLELSDDGRLRLESAIPAFTEAYQALLAELEAAGADTEALFAALTGLRRGIAETNRRLDAGHLPGDGPRSGRRFRGIVRA